MQPFLAYAIMELFINKSILPEYVEKVMGYIFGAIDDGTEDVVNAWYPTFCIGIRSINWKGFNDKLLPKIFKLAGINETYVSRNAAAQIISTASILAAEKKAFNGPLMHSFLELLQDANAEIRKFTLSNLKLLFKYLEPSEVEKLFLSELVPHLNDPNNSIRHIAMQIALDFQHCISTQNLQKEYVPVLIKEFEQGWKYIEDWLLNNCASAVHFLTKRKLLQEDNIPAINSFFDVITYKINYY